MAKSTEAQSTPKEGAQASITDPKAALEQAAQSTAEVNKAAEQGEMIQTSPTFTPKVNTTQSVASTTTTQMGEQLTEASIKRDLKLAAKQLKAKKLKTISIPKQLASVLGDTLPACINGVCINVPVDGEDYEVPEPFVELIRTSLKTINSGDVRATLDAGANEDFLKVSATK